MTPIVKIRYERRIKELEGLTLQLFKRTNSLADELTTIMKEYAIQGKELKEAEQSIYELKNGYTMSDDYKTLELEHRDLSEQYTHLLENYNKLKEQQNNGLV